MAKDFDLKIIYQAEFYTGKNFTNKLGKNFFSRLIFPISTPKPNKYKSFSEQ